MFPLSAVLHILSHVHTLSLLIKKRKKKKTQTNEEENNEVTILRFFCFVCFMNELSHPQNEVLFPLFSCVCVCLPDVTLAVR